MEGEHNNSNNSQQSNQNLTNNDNNQNVTQQQSEQNYENELHQVMSSSEHFTETIQYRNDQYFQQQQQQQQQQQLFHIIQLSQDEIQEVIDFWYDMELLIMAAVHGTIHIDIHSNGNKYEHEHEHEYEYEHEHEHDIITVAAMPNRNNDNNNATSRKEWRIIHALAQSGCPHEIAKLAILLYPEQITQKDEFGNLPLHIACSSHSTSNLAEGDSLSFNKNENNNNNNSIHHHHHHTNDDTVSCDPCSCSCPPMIKHLLNAYPQATMIQNMNHRLPITIALYAGKYWHTGIYHIFKSNPIMVLAGLSRDVEKSNLYSFMVAATTTTVDLGLLSTVVSLPPIAITTVVTSSSSSIEVMRRAQRIASKKIGSMWRFLPKTSKDRAVKEAKIELEKMKLNTIYELLRINPEACCIERH